MSPKHTRRIVPILLSLLLVSLEPVSAAAMRSAPTRLAPPKRVQAVALNAQEVDLAWTAVPGVAGYLIRRDQAELAGVSASTLSYVDTTVQPATEYAYTVLTVDTSGASSPPSHPAEVKTPSLPETRDTTPPSEPEDFTVTEQPGEVLLDWYAASDDSDVTGYVIYRDGQVLAVVDSATTSYRDTTAQPGVTHTYSVEARDVVDHRTRSHSDAGKRGPGNPRNPPTSTAPSSDTFMGPLAAAATQLRRYPYLTDLVNDAGAGYATLNWATDTSATVGSATWGAVDAAGACTPTTTVTASRSSINVNSVTEYQWKAPLALAPETQYCYRVFLGVTDLLGTDPSPRFWTQLPQGAATPFSFAFFADWGEVDSTSSNPDQANLMSHLAASGARFAIAGGDNGYPSGSQSNYGDLVQTGPSLSGVFGPQFWAVPGRSIPLFPVLGNHGMSSSSTFHPHLINWPQDKAVATSSGRYVRDTYCCLNGTTSAAYPSVWYAFDAGPARFYLLDSAWANSNVGTADMYKNDFDYHWTSTSPEWTWLQADLQSHPRPLKFAFFHFPVYSDQASETSDHWLQGPSPRLEGFLAAQGVQIAFTGHAHLHERNNKSDLGLVTYLSGGGGAKLQSIGGNGCSAVDAYGIGWSNTHNRGNACGAAPVPSSMAQVFHFLLVSLNGTTVAVAPTNSLGQTFDVQTYTFGTADTSPPIAPTNLTATAASTAQVDLAWTASTDNVGVTGYTVVRNGAPLTRLGPQTSFSDTTVAASTTYTYTLQAEDAAGNRSPASNAATVTTPAAPVAPASPTNLGATPGNAQVSLSWTASSGASSYTVKRGTASGGPYAAVATGLTATSFTDTTVVNGTTYFYVVTATNAAGESSNSNEVSAQPVAPAVVTATFSPEADSYVDNVTPTANFGAGATLKVDTSPSLRNAYLRFTVSGVTGTVQSARLRVFSVDPTSNGPQVFATSNAWTETGITWNNQPGSTGTASDDKGAISINTFVEFDVTPLVAAGNGSYSLVLIPQSSDGFDMASREATTAANRPQLVLTVAQ
jgi:fibronectin type 3 domain-containing protein